MKNLNLARLPIPPRGLLMRRVCPTAFAWLTPHNRASTFEGKVSQRFRPAQAPNSRGLFEQINFLYPGQLPSKVKHKLRFCEQRFAMQRLKSLCQIIIYPSLGAVGPGMAQSTAIVTRQQPGLAELGDAVAAKADLWGEAALTQANGPSYEFFKAWLAFRKQDRHRTRLISEAINSPEKVHQFTLSLSCNQPALGWWLQRCQQLKFWDYWQPRLRRVRSTQWRAAARC